MSKRKEKMFYWFIISMKKNTDDHKPELARSVMPIELSYAPIK